MIKINKLKFCSWLFFGLAVLFVYAPIIIMVLFSLNSGGSLSGWEDFSLKWYKELFSSEAMTSAIINSLKVGLSTTFFSLFTALLLVCGSYQWHPWWLLKIFTINLSMPEIFLAVVMLGVFSIIKFPMGLITIVAGHTLIGFGTVIPMIYAAFKDINKHIFDSSFDLGATFPQTFRYILYPLLKKTLISAGFLVFTISMDDFFINFFCSGTSFPTVPTTIYTMIRASVDPTLNALSSLLFILSLSIILMFIVWNKINNFLARNSSE